MILATKARLLAGGAPEPFQVPALDGDEVMLRPLSSPEAEAVQSAQVAGIRASQDRDEAPKDTAGKVNVIARGSRRPASRLDIDFEKVIAGNYRAEALAAAYGLADPELTIEEVRAIRPVEVVEQIGQEVMRRSGLGSNQREQIARFRDLAERASDAGAPPEREPAGDDAGGADAPPA